MSEQICTFHSMGQTIEFGHVTGSLNIEFRERIFRCRDCAHIKPTTDGRNYCKRWSHIVPDDGFCWRGEEA